MNEAIEKLKDKLTDELKSMEIVVDEVIFYEKDKYKFLNVVLDKVGGIDLDTIVEASGIVNKVADKIDIPCDDYILDVISKERG